MQGITLGYDVTHINLPKVPKGAQLAGYITGTPDVIWSNSDKAAHPDAVLIDQSPMLSTFDETADVLDFENGAATLDDVPKWAKAALVNFATARRPGQRSPLVYASLFNLTPVANKLVAAGLDKGQVGFWVAAWGGGEPNAALAVMSGSGPFPIRAFQYLNLGAYDADVFDTAWLENRSAKNVPPVPVMKGIVVDESLSTFAVTSTDRNTWKA